jgi:hypothetical protein
MIEQSFALIPFPAPILPAVCITGSASLQDRLLTLKYSLSGALEEVLLPRVSLNPSRRDDLWKETCFEFFVAVKDQPGYWEFNMSPSGDWNVYRMDAYRRVGFREERAIDKLPFEVQYQPDIFQLHVTVDLSPMLQPIEDLEIGIAAVIQTQDGETTYWALAHPAPQADFHLRESFTLALAGRTLPAPPSARDA